MGDCNRDLFLLEIPPSAGTAGARAAWGVKGTSRILGRGARPARPHAQQVLTALRTWFVNPRASMSNY